MRVITGQQARKLAKTVERETGEWYEEDEIRDAMVSLCAALEHGLVLDSGNGFYYGLDRKNKNRLVCHDGSELNERTIYQQIASYVWTPQILANVVSDIVEQGIPVPGDEGYDAEYWTNVVREIIEACV